MRILVLATAARHSGALTVLESLHDFARENAQKHQWVFVVGSDLIAPAPGVEVVVDAGLQRNRVRRLLFDLGAGLSRITSQQPDVVLSLNNTMPPRLGCRRALYVHQSIPFQDQVRFSLFDAQQRHLAVYQHLIGKLIKQSVRRSDLVIVQSHWMRQAVADATGIEADEILVIPPSPPSVELPRPRPAFNPDSFIYPANGASYKNTQVIIDAVRHLRGNGVTEVEVRLTAAPPAEAQGVVNLGRVSREDLMRHMSTSTLLFPSLFETVGLPLLEARALGVPVLAADLPYAREMLAGYPNARFFNPRDPVRLAELMRQVMLGNPQPGAPAPLESDGGWGVMLRALDA